MQPLKISVIIPTYRRQMLLMRCLKALWKQDFAMDKFEIIVVCDGEDPETLRSLDEMPVERFPSIQYFSLPRKAGPAAARNFGWRLALGELVVFTDDDCIPSEGWLQALWSAYQSMRVHEIAFSGNTIVPLADEPTDYEKNISQLAAAEFITANCACTRKALHRVGGFDERFRMAWREDSDLQFKFILHGIPIQKVPEAVVTRPIRKAPWGVSIKEERKGMFNALLYKKYPLLYKEKIKPAPSWHYYAITFFLVVMITGFVSGESTLMFIGCSGWLLMTLWFAWTRLRATSHSWNHVFEMIFTSAVIPVLSLFWKFYGSWKFKSLSIR